MGSIPVARYSTSISHPDLTFQHQSRSNLLMVELELPHMISIHAITACVTWTVLPEISLINLRYLDFDLSMPLKVKHTRLTKKW